MAQSGGRAKGSERRFRSAAAISIVAAFLVCAKGGANAQTADYFGSPWLGTSNMQGAEETGTYAPGLYARLQGQLGAPAPAWYLSEHVGVDEIVTDNSGNYGGDRNIDLGSLFSAGFVATADTPRLNGIFSATGIYRREINDAALNRFGGYGYTREQATIVPDWLYFYVRGLADGFSREGGGLQNPLGQESQDTQVYEISGIPILYSQVDDVGVNVLRYQIGQVWFDHNTGALQFAGLALGPITSSTDQLAREDFRMAGTILPRLLTDVSLSASENNSGLSGSGDFMRDRGELIDEYEVTRAASLIGGIGYERLNDNEFPTVNGEDLLWDVGGRFRPDADSYALLTYGRHDLASDFAGELVWRITPLTNIYAAYTDSITNGQQQLLASYDASELGPEGSLSHVAFDQSTVIGTLDDTLLNAAPGVGGPSIGGVPLAELNNALPLENGLFRTKIFRGTVHSLFDDDPLNLTLLHLERTQLTQAGVFGDIGRVETSEGAILSWHPELSLQVRGLLALRYERLTLDQNQLLPFDHSSASDHYGASIGATWTISRTITGVVRYDFTYGKLPTGTGTTNAYLNILTVGLHKTFD